MDKQWEHGSSDEYDIAELEEKNGIKSAKNIQPEEKSSTEQLENKLGVSAKEETTKDVPRERIEALEDTTEGRAEKNGVRSTNQKDNVKKKKASGNKSKYAEDMKKAAKREMKNLIINQILKEEENSESRAIDNTQFFLKEFCKNIGRKSAVLAYKGMKYALMLGTQILILGIQIIFLLAPVLLVMITAILAMAAIAVIAGIFVTPENAALEDFAVNRIIAYQQELVCEAESYGDELYNGYYVEEVNIRYKGVPNIDANSDDILLAYMTYASDGNYEGEVNPAPLLNVDTSNEMSSMEEVLEDMLYISDVTYEKNVREIKVTATPTPTVNPTPTIAPVTEITITPSPAPSLVPTPIMTPEPSPVPTLSPLPTPTPTPEVIIIEEVYYVVNVTITGVEADIWVIENVSGKKESMYSLLRDLFDSFGYQSLGGDTVCQKYLNADVQ